MSGHTPGPWKAGRSDMATIVDGVDSKWVYAGGQYVAAASGYIAGDWSEVIANAYLIAASPDMLAALKYVQRELAYVDGPWAEIVDSAIEKAEPK